MITHAKGPKAQRINKYHNFRTHFGSSELLEIEP